MLRIDKLGFYRAQDSSKIEIIYFNKCDDSEFIAVGKKYYKHIEGIISFITYTDEYGAHSEDRDYNLIEYLWPTEVEWKVPRKISFVSYLNESYIDNFDLNDSDCVVSALFTAEPTTGTHSKPRKISKWRFYGEEIIRG